MSQKFEELVNIGKGMFNKYPYTEYQNELRIDDEVYALSGYVSQNIHLTNSMVEYLNKFIETFDEKLKPHVVEQLLGWLEDGTLETIINETIFKDLSDGLTKLKKHSLNSDYIVSLNFYPRLNGETNDTERVKRAILDCVPNTILCVNEVIELTETIKIDKLIHLSMSTGEFKAVQKGLPCLIEYNFVKGLTVKGVSFNLNLMGRMGLKLNDCNFYKLDDLFLTGYSKEYGYYHTDGGIQINRSKYGRGSNITWENHGEQYTSATPDLNRCLTIQGYSDFSIWTNLVFNKVNQAIVIDGGSHIVDGVLFEDVQDNDIYAFGSGEKTFTNITTNTLKDESIVISGGVYKINNVSMKNCPNKFIALSGNVDSLIIDTVSMNNNNLESSSQGQFIATRDGNHRIKKLTLNNVEMTQDSVTTGYDYNYFGYVDELYMDNVRISVKTEAYQKLFSFANTVKGKISNSKFVGTDYTSIAVELKSADSQIIWEDNELINCRILAKGLVLKEYGVQFNVGPYVTERKNRSIIFSDEKPTTGTWKIGDLCFKNNPLASSTIATVTGFIGWVYTSAGQWDVFGQIGIPDIRTRAGSPINWIAPTYIGEMVLDTTTNNVWMGIVKGNQTSAGWKLLT